MRNLKDTPEFHKALSEAAASTLGYKSDSEESIYLSGKALAELLNVSPPAVSQAVKNDTQLKGYYVKNWAAINSRDRAVGYYVPINIYQKLQGRIATGSGQSRSNPSSLEVSNNGEFGELLELAGGNTTVHSPTSLLPEGEDYSMPVGLAGASYVFRDLLDTDKPQGKAFTMALITGGLAAVGKLLFESNTAGAAGGVAGFIISMLNIESAFTKRMWERKQRLEEQQRPKRVFVPVPEQKRVKKESEKPTIQLVK